MRHKNYKRVKEIGGRDGKRQTVKEEEPEKEERNIKTTVKNCLDSCVRTLAVCKNQLIKAALMACNN